MKNEIYDFTDFIGKSSLATLASCASLVGVTVQALKIFIPWHPLGLSFLVSFLLSLIKLILSSDYTKENVLLAVINTVPMALTASGGYDLINKISVK